MKNLDNPMLCLNVCNDLTTKNSIGMTHCQKCYVSAYKFGNNDTKCFGKNCCAHDKHLKIKQNRKDANEIKRIEPTRIIHVVKLSPLFI